MKPGQADTRVLICLSVEPKIAFKIFWIIHSEKKQAVVFNCWQIIKQMVGDYQVYYLFLIH